MVYAPLLHVMRYAHEYVFNERQCLWIDSCGMLVKHLLVAQVYEANSNQLHLFYIDQSVRGFIGIRWMLLLDI